MKFNYTCIEDKFIPGNYAYLPLVDINIGKYKLPIRCLIDSGSPITIIHSPLGVAAGIIPAEGKISNVLGIGGEIVKGYYHKIKLNLYDNNWSSEVFFTPDLKTPFCLLGQTGFFQHFRVIFNLQQRQFEIAQNYEK